ncbi:MAG TPA: hypothetical protein VNU70_12555 [Puia sp.]|jgi:hypothetical protein|nr:hypothetical protein [Puia sp.]
MTLTPVCGGLYSWIERKSHKKSYPFFLTLILVLVSLFLGFPRYDLLDTEPVPSEWQVTMLKANDLTNSLTRISPDNFLSKKVFRLTVPVFIRLLHLNRTEVLAIQAVLGFLLIFFAYKLAFRILQDSPSATMVAAGIVFIYAGKACFIDIATHFDGWAYFFLLMALYPRNPFLIFIFATLAAWVDERGALALMFPILFHQMEAAKAEDFSWRRLIRPTTRGVAVAAAVAAYLALRLYLTHAFNMHTPSNGADLSALKENALHTTLWFGTFTFLEGFWLLVPIVILLSIQKKQVAVATLLIGFICIYCMATFFVFDLTRSGSYLFSAIFVLLIYLRESADPSFIRTMTSICFFFCFIFPSMNYIAFQDFLFHIDKPFFEVLAALLRKH